MLSLSSAQQMCVCTAQELLFSPLVSQNHNHGKALPPFLAFLPKSMLLPRADKCRETQNPTHSRMLQEVRAVKEWKQTTKVCVHCLQINLLYDCRLCIKQIEPNITWTAWTMWNLYSDCSSNLLLLTHLCSHCLPCNNDISLHTGTWGLKATDLLSFLKILFLVSNY